MQERPNTGERQFRTFTKQLRGNKNKQTQSTLVFTAKEIRLQNSNPHTQSQLGYRQLLNWSTIQLHMKEKKRIIASLRESDQR